MRTPSVIVFDVNETLSDMSHIAERFEAIGAPGHLAKLWFAQLLRDGFALAATGRNIGFADIGAEVMREVLHDVPLNMGVEDAVSHVMGGIKQLGVHPDVPHGVQALNAAGFSVVTLSNGATAVAEQLFDQAGLTDEFERLLSVDGAPAWKPDRSAYEHAARECGVKPAEMMLVAVHPWGHPRRRQRGSQHRVAQPWRRPVAELFRGTGCGGRLLGRARGRVGGSKS